MMRNGKEDLEFMQTFDLVLRIYGVALFLAVIIVLFLIARPEKKTFEFRGEFLKSSYKAEADDVPH